MNKEAFIKDYFVDRRHSPSRKWQGLKDDEIALSVADMDFASPKSVSAGLKEMLELRAFGYTALPFDYFEVFKNYYLRHHQIAIEKDEIFFDDGAIAALYHIIDCFLNKGDKILICPPVYHQFANLIKTSEHTLVISPLIKSKRTFIIDYEDIENKFKDGVKLMILCNPHNPTGHIYTREELERLGDLALKYHVYIISDEVHADFAYGGQKYTPFMGLKKYEEIAFGVMGVSKTFNLALFAHSHVIIKDPILKDKYAKFLKVHHLGNPKYANALASYYAYRDGDKWLKMINAIIYDNYRFVASYLDEMGLYYSELEGTYLMFIDLEKILNGEKIEDFINRWRVSVNLGKVFGEGYETYVRLNLATHPDLIKEVMKRLKSLIKE